MHAQNGPPGGIGQGGPGFGGGAGIGQLPGSRGGAGTGPGARGIGGDPDPDHEVSLFERAL